MIEKMIAKKSMNEWSGTAKRISLFYNCFFISLSSPHFSVNIWKSRLCHPSEMCYRGKECEEVLILFYYCKAELPFHRPNIQPRVCSKPLTLGIKLLQFIPLKLLKGILIKQKSRLLWIQAIHSHSNWGRSVCCIYYFTDLITGITHT